MPRMQKEIFPRAEYKGEGRGENKMSQMRQQEESTPSWQFLRQDIQEELIPAGPGGKKKPSRKQQDISNLFRQLKGWVLPALFALLIPVSIISCQHPPSFLLEPDKSTRTFEADEKIILKAIARVLKERGFGEAKILRERLSLETEYVIQEDWRTKVEASVKKLNRREREVSLSVITEKKTSSGWEFRKILDREQYEKLFYEIELQIYREMSKIE